MADVPKRIVSLVPSHTETLHALGLADSVVGRTRFCIHPSTWVESIPHVGGTKDASSAKILALNPDLVVADKDENPIDLVKELEAAGIEVLWSDIDTVPDAVQFIEQLARRCGADAAGSRIAEDIWAAACDVAFEDEPIPVFCPIWHDPWMTFNKTAYPHAMLAAVGLHNVFAQKSGTKYFEVQSEDVAASDAEFTLLPTEPYPFHKRRAEASTEALGVSGHASRVMEIDGEALTWFGVRTAVGLRELARVRERLMVL